MREPKAPTLDEMLAEYQRISGRNVEGKTVVEWAEEWKIGPERARAVLAYAIKSGKMVAENALRKVITRPGYRCTVTLIRFVKGKR